MSQVHDSGELFHPALVAVPVRGPSSPGLPQRSGGWSMGSHGPATTQSH